MASQIEVRSLKKRALTFHRRFDKIGGDILDRLEST
jgi:hypothetical protein